MNWLRGRWFYNEHGMRAGWRLLLWVLLFIAGTVALLAVAALLLRWLSPVRWGVVMNGILVPATPQLPWWLLLPLDAGEFLISFGAAALIARRFEKRPVGSLGLSFASGWRREFGLGCLLGLALLSVCILALVGLGVYRFDGLQQSILPALGWGLLMAAGFIGLGLFEEFSSRGYLLQNLAGSLGVPAAALITCLDFTLPHCLNQGENPIGIAGVLVAAILLLVMVLKTRRLWMAVGFHAAWDWGQNFLYGTPNSGITMPHGLIHTAIGGPDWLSGGAVGPEGSVLTVGVLALACLVLARTSSLRPTSEVATLWDRYVVKSEAGEVS